MTEQDDREPRACPRCGEVCTYDGWGHVHANGRGIGSCSPNEPRPPDEPGNPDLDPSDDPPAPSTTRTVRQSARYNEQAWGISVETAVPGSADTASDEGLRGEVERLRRELYDETRTTALLHAALGEAHREAAATEAQRDALQHQVDAVKGLCDQADASNFPSTDFHGNPFPVLLSTAQVRAVLSPEADRGGER